MDRKAEERAVGDREGHYVHYCLLWVARQRDLLLETKRRALRSLSLLDCKAEGPAVGDKEKGTTFTAEDIMQNVD